MLGDSISGRGGNLCASRLFAAFRLANNVATMNPLRQLQVSARYLRNCFADFEKAWTAVLRYQPVPFERALDTLLRIEKWQRIDASDLSAGNELRAVIAAAESIVAETETAFSTAGVSEPPVAPRLSVAEQLKAMSPKLKAAVISEWAAAKGAKGGKQRSPGQQKALDDLHARRAKVNRDKAAAKENRRRAARERAARMSPKDSET